MRRRERRKRKERKQEMFRYHPGQCLRIKEGIYAGKTFIVKEEGRVMSSGSHPLPQYFYERHGRWFHEEEVEPVHQKKEQSID